MTPERRRPKRPAATVPLAVLGAAMLVAALVVVHTTAAVRATCGARTAGPCGAANLRYDGGLLLASIGAVVLGGALVAAYGRALAARRAGHPWPLRRRRRRSRPRVLDLRQPD